MTPVQHALPIRGIEKTCHFCSAVPELKDRKGLADLAQVCAS